MSGERLKYHQIAMLLVLMAEGVPDVPNTKLTDFYKLKFTNNKDREALVEGKLIECDKTRKPMTWSLTDAGRDRVMEEILLGVDVPSSRVLGLAFVTYLQNTRAPRIETPPLVAEASAALSAEEVETRIREAYVKVAPGAGRWASITKLRAELTGIDRDLQDAVLRTMMLAGRVDIEPVAILGDLKPEDRDAAIIIGSTPNHQFRIGA
ncbi:hypothetical protein [Herbidospora yilanensis]|uniref:hypothetical protein n=1 Tax=Herbidospora yilanensis TaxID=354426 RepID=UPI00078554A7|nr:hypothetical protein [Herbidospora yilanensis]